MQFREFSAKGRFAADVIISLCNSGVLVPNVLNNAFVVQDFGSQHTTDAHVIFDGFPRDTEQASVCDELFELFSRDHLDIVYLDTAEEVVMERMLKRVREDDTDEVIAKRLSQYRENTEPLIAFYKNRPNTTVHVVDGAGTEEEVQAAITTALNI